MMYVLTRVEHKWFVIVPLVKFLQSIVLSCENFIL